ncbi:serine/threonine dehydratase [Reticulibacter mediterranei]|uniref:Serine/threonine dehydratase n=2 Tax=Reticulibacter mediterranei TaxID=2778369 RepID=A0A8J3IVA2_9CHLR|nr:serine/threonine dehydratase [Reticulibacter mediterranei]
MAQTTTITLRDIETAAQRIAGYACPTPVLTSSRLDDQTEGTIYLKCENLQRTGAFKFRGAFNRLSVLTSEERQRGVVAYSSGNHALAVALSGKLLGIPVTVILPDDAVSSKIATAKLYGAHVLIADPRTEDLEEIAQSLARERDLVFISPYDDPYVIAGQGTVMHEMWKQIPHLDLLVLPCGGGSLIAGSCIAVKEYKPKIHVIGVETVDGNDTFLSLCSGHPVHISRPTTIADGIRAQSPGRLTFPIEQELLEQIVLVTDEDIKAALRFLLLEVKVLVEPTGAVALAALLSGKVDTRGKRVGVVLSGGNIDSEILLNIMSSGLAKDNRYHREDDLYEA